MFFGTFVHLNVCSPDAPFAALEYIENRSYTGSLKMIGWFDHDMMFLQFGSVFLYGFTPSRTLNFFLYELRAPIAELT